MMSKSKRFCSVPQCRSYASKDVSMHYFPNDEKIVKEWKSALKIAKPISKFMNVCSKHFLREDFMPGETKRKRLKKGVVPSQNLPSLGQDTKHKETELRSPSPPDIKEEEIDSIGSNEVPEVLSPKREMDFEIEINQLYGNVPRTYCDTSTQTDNSDGCAESLTVIIKSEKTVCSKCGHLE